MDDNIDSVSDDIDVVFSEDGDVADDYDVLEVVHMDGDGSNSADGHGSPGVEVEVVDEHVLVEESDEDDEVYTLLCSSISTISITHISYIINVTKCAFYKYI